MNILCNLQLHHTLHNFHQCNEHEWKFIIVPIVALIINLNHNIIMMKMQGR